MCSASNTQVLLQDSKTVGATTKLCPVQLKTPSESCCRCMTIVTICDDLASGRERGPATQPRSGWAMKKFHMILSALMANVVAPKFVALAARMALPGHVCPPPLIR